MEPLKTAVVTGAGSGVGRAVALRLAHENWRVMILGRRLDALHQTVRLAGQEAPNLIPHRCDISKVDEVEAMAGHARATLGHIDVLVNSAGTNVPRRSSRSLPSPITAR